MIVKSHFLKENMMPDYVKNIPLNDLPEFCTELRQQLIEIVSKTGGHIGVNLAVVELTVALYYVFNFPKDSIIWDIGHQIYIQKMLTGRLKNLYRNRQNDGSPGFANKEESIFDRVTSSHAGASVSLALGVAISNRLQKNENFSIAVVGDGAYVEGSIQEAVNHMAVDDSKLLVILNDNEMAIEKNFGGLHEYFKSRKINTDIDDTFFSSLGIPYHGPYDGHDVIKLVKNFSEIKKSITKPTLLHIKTIKGKGLEFMAQSSPIQIHWNQPFNPVTGKDTVSPRAKNHSSFSAEAIEEIMDKNSEAVTITPAVQSTHGLNNLFQKYPDRCFDVSLAEQHAITLGGGFALQGMKPIIAMESSFMQRTFDQIHHDICLNNLPVLIIAARSGHTGTDHISHNALNDFAYTRCIPNLKIIFPSSHRDIKEIIINEYNQLKQPTLILFSKADVLDDPKEIIPTDNDDFIKSSLSSGLILSVGSQNKIGVELKKMLYKDGVIFDHISVTNIFPLSVILRRSLKNYSYIITLEEGILDGGFGSQIAEILADEQSLSKQLRVGFKKQFVQHGTREYIYKKFSLDSISTYNKIKNTWSELWKK